MKKGQNSHLELLDSRSSINQHEAGGKNWECNGSTQQSPSKNQKQKHLLIPVQYNKETKWLILELRNQHSYPHYRVDSKFLENSLKFP